MTHQSPTFESRANYKRYGSIFFYDDCILFNDTKSQREIPLLITRDDEETNKEEASKKLKVIDNSKSILIELMNSNFIALKYFLNFFSKDLEKYSKNFKINTPAIESNDKELKSIKIDLSFIDVVYYINYNENDNSRNYNLIARQKYKDECVYVDLLVNVNDDKRVSGEIFLSKNLNLFMFESEITDCKKEEIYTYLENVENVVFNIRKKYYCTTCNNTFIHSS